MYPFRRLSVWVKAHELTLRIYEATDGPFARRYPALSSQLRRSIAAIHANIAEGAGHSTDPQFNRYLEIALAAAREADYHLLLAKDLGAISSRDYAVLEARVCEVRGMMMGLRKRVLERIKQNVRRGGRTAAPLTPHTLHPSATK
jgi:four helix bundle protein